jgi:hypothetical protein
MLLEKLRNWNPQLFREIKGRLQGRNIAIAVSLSLMTQFLSVGMYFYIQRPADDQGYNHFLTCMEQMNHKCVLSVINWQKWWFYLSILLSVILFCTLVLGVVYMLMSDLAQEEKRGTLNLIRLSPQSSEKILLGKLLGVPILLYLAILMAIPLHLYAAMGAKINLRLVVGSYLLAGVICSSLYIVVMLSTFPWRLSPWFYTLFSAYLLLPLLPLLNVFLYDVNDFFFNKSYLRWFDLPLGESMALAYCFTVATFGGVTYGSWQCLNHRFPNPNATLLTKGQSYYLVFFTNLWLLGFAWHNSRVYYSQHQIVYFYLFLIVPFCFLLLVRCLSLTGQTLQDWARYQVGRSKKALVQELIWGEKSPSTIAIGVNLVITALIWMPWLLLFNDLSPQSGYHLSQIQVVISFVLMVNMILLGSVICQIILMTKQPKLQRLAGEIIGIILTLPLLFGASNPQKFWIWLFSVAPISIKYISNTTIFLVILSQGTMLTLLSFQLTRQLKKAGESTTKTLLIPSIRKT